MCEYFMGLWQQRVGKTAMTITMLANGEETKDMDTMEYLGNLILLIVGGNDTTRNSMSASIYGSNLFPAEWEKVRANRDLIPNTVAEIIRGKRLWPICAAPLWKMWKCTARPLKKAIKSPCGMSRAIAMSANSTIQCAGF